MYFSNVSDNSIRENRFQHHGIFHKHELYKLYVLIDLENTMFFLLVDVFIHIYLLSYAAYVPEENWIAIQVINDTTTIKNVVLVSWFLVLRYECELWGWYMGSIFTTHCKSMMYALCQILTCTSYTKH